MCVRMIERVSAGVRRVTQSARRCLSLSAVDRHAGPPGGKWDYSYLLLRGPLSAKPVILLKHASISRAFWSRDRGEERRLNVLACCGSERR